MSAIGIADLIDNIGVLAGENSIVKSRLDRVRRAEESYRKAMSAAADAKGLGQAAQVVAYSNECEAAAPLVFALYGLLMAVVADRGVAPHAEGSNGHDD